METNNTTVEQAAPAAAPEATLSSVPVAEAAPAPETAAPEANTLTIQDLQVLANVVDVASQRGAFRANELENVGRVYNKLNNFLTSVKSAAEANAEKK